jgi:hypothetical protein
LRRSPAKSKGSRDDTPRSQARFRVATRRSGHLVRAPEPPAAKAVPFTARLDVTPDLRGRIKIAAFNRGITVAEMLRDLLTREFPANPGGTA